MDAEHKRGILTENGFSKMIALGILLHNPFEG
jgi:hypothetical protein